MAQRSDELTFKRHDVISVLHKDSNQWWMGVLKANGSQGFFPSNYVILAEEKGTRGVYNQEFLDQLM